MSVNIYDKTTKQLTVIAGKNPGDNIVIDQALSISSENPVQNKVISQRLNQLDTSKVGRFSTMPTPSSTYNSEIVQYIGNTTNDYIKGHFYECVYEDGSYSWNEVLFGAESSGDTIQYETMPTASQDLLGKVIQYVGTTDNTYTKGYFYECIYVNGSYLWDEIISESEGDVIQYETMPNANADWVGEVIQYVGATNNNYIKGYFYECVYENEMYFWKPVEFMTGASIQYSEMPTPGPAWLDRIVQYTGTVAPYTNGFFYKCVYNSDDDEYNWVEWFVQPTTEPIHLVDVSGATIEREFKVATIYWTDPDNSVIDSQTVAQWAGTKLVRKIGSAPQHEFDGDLIINEVTKNSYSEEGFVDDTLEYDKVYYYRFFPYSTTNVVTKGTSIRVNCQRVQVPLPSQVGNLYYNKQTQEPTLTSEVGITTSGETSGKNAGDYEMTLSLISDDYQWSDKSFTDKTITWTIQKAQATITPSSSNVTLGRRSITSKSISFSDLYDRTITNINVSDSDICTATIVGDEILITLGSDVGDTTVTVTTNSTDNSLQASAVISVTSILQIVYGFHIDGTESDPSAMVSYLVNSDNYNYNPAHMNYSNGTFDYGSWQEDEFFMPRPCMLRYDGTVAYYLDPDDYTKKENGNLSDVADPTFEGNAMMEWGRDGYKIWYKIVPDSDSDISASIYISNYQVDEDYVDWSFHNCDSESVDHFYTPIYNGSLVDGKLRSISGQNVLNNKTATDLISYAKANNPSTQEMWNIECFADRQLINFLLILIGKSTNTQAVFGQGACNNGSESVNNTFTTGVHNDKGLFYGTNSGNIGSYNFSNCVKIFGMENYWGFVWRKTNGLIYISNNQKVKFTYGQEDGSKVTGYNTNGNNYIALGISISGTYGGYINQMKFTDKGMFSKQASGSGSTYYTDVCWFLNGTQFSMFGGDSDNSGDRSGAFYLSLDADSSNKDWNMGAALSLKPLKEEEE